LDGECGFLILFFLKRNWDKDVQKINTTFQHLIERKINFWLISHLEGTRFHERKLHASHEYAKKHNLPILHHCLLPRTKGFIATLKGLRDSNTIKAVYDFTILYNDGKSTPPLGSMFYGKYILKDNYQVHIHVRRYPIESIPRDDKAIAEWVYKIWTEKDDLIEEFYKIGRFPNQLNELYQHLPLKFD